MATDPTPELREEVERLVDAAREGDRAAFDELVRRTYVDTYTLAVRLTANEEDARDVVQEAYLRAWKGIDRFRGDAQFSTWMYRITANAASTLVQKRRRRRAESARDRRTSRSRPPLEAQPEAAAESAIGLEQLSARSQQLPPKLRRIVVLKDVYGLAARGHRRGARHLGGRGEGPAAPGPEASCGTCCSRRTGGRPMRCEDVARLLPETVDGTGPSTWPCRRTSSRACAARPSWPATGGCCAPSSSCGPATSSPRPACSPRPWPRSRRSASARRCGRSSRAAASPTPAPSAAPRWPRPPATAAAVLVARSRRRAAGA